MSYETDRLHFHNKRLRDLQKARALAQFGNGRKPPPNNDPPSPTRMRIPSDLEVIDAKSKVA